VDVEHDGDAAECRYMPNAVTLKRFEKKQVRSGCSSLVGGLIASQYEARDSKFEILTL